MDEDTYLEMLERHPQLWRRPDLIKNPSQNTRDFIFDETSSSKRMILARQKTDAGNFVGLPRSIEQARHESIYFDAYAGIESLDEEAELKNNQLLDEFKENEPDMRELVTRRTKVTHPETEQIETTGPRTGRPGSPEQFEEVNVSPLSRPKPGQKLKGKE